MTKDRVLELMNIELKCISRNEEGSCDRDCSNCDLVQETEELIEAYNYVINILKEKSNV